ncbi:MAG: caspase family protein [Ardenticatenales bacterium]|nr:caspase family protein [Ardenticatenales bacterium]
MARENKQSQTQQPTVHQPQPTGSGPAGALSPHNGFLNLQRQLGNQAVQRLLNQPSRLPAPLQRQLFIQRQEPPDQTPAPQGHTVVGAGAETPVKSVGGYGETLLKMLEADKTRQLSIQQAVQQAAQIDQGIAAPTSAEAGNPNLDTSTGRRLGLIITNSQYEEPETDLPKTATDGERMAAILNGREFAVNRQTDLPAAQMSQVIAEFVAQGAPHDDLVVFYSGHGLVGGMQGTDNQTVAPSVVGGWSKTALEKGFQLTLIIEACHAGSTADFVRREEITRIEGHPDAAGPTVARALAGIAAGLQAQKDKLAILERAKQALMESPQVDALLANDTLEAETEKHNQQILAAWTAAEPELQKLAAEVQKLTQETLTIPTGPYNEEWLNTKQLDQLDTMTNRTLELARAALNR